jgi:hypothetical protein
MKAKIWLVFKKLNGPADLSIPVKLPVTFMARLASVFSRENVLAGNNCMGCTVHQRTGRRIPPNLFGALIATNEEPRKLLFVARKGARPFAGTIDLEGSIVAREPRFLSENLIILPAVGKGPKYLFIFPRPHVGVVEQIVHDLRERLSAAPSHADLVDKEGAAV